MDYTAWWNAQMHGYDRMMAMALAFITFAAWMVTKLYPSSCILNLVTHFIINALHVGVVHGISATYLRQHRTKLILSMRMLYIAAAVVLHPTCIVHTRVLQGHALQRAAFALGITTCVATAATMPLPLTTEIIVQLASMATFGLTRVSWACGIIARISWLSELMHEQVQLVQELTGHVVYFHGCPAEKAYGLPVPMDYTCIKLAVYLIVIFGLAAPMLATCVAHHRQRLIYTAMLLHQRNPAASDHHLQQDWSVMHLGVLFVYAWVLAASLGWMLISKPFPWRM